MTLPVVAEAYKVVSVIFSSSQGPSIKSISAKVKLVAVVLVSFAGSWSLCARYNTSADCA